jgi:hypothetical protein
MDLITRKDFANGLRRDWGRFVARFRALSNEEQQKYLARQGYASLGALLAHILAWWMDGQQIVDDMRGKPGLSLPDYDVDQFNARAVEKFDALDEDAMVELFEAQRFAMLGLVTNLSESEIQQENINTRLYYEIIMHWKEHE